MLTVLLFFHKLPEQVLVVEVELVVDGIRYGVVGVIESRDVASVLELFQFRGLVAPILHDLLLQYLPQLLPSLQMPPLLFIRLLFDHLPLPLQQLPFVIGLLLLPDPGLVHVVEVLRVDIVPVLVEARVKLSKLVSTCLKECSLLRRPFLRLALICSSWCSCCLYCTFCCCLRAISSSKNLA